MSTTEYIYLVDAAKEQIISKTTTQLGVEELTDTGGSSGEVHHTAPHCHHTDVITIRAVLVNLGS